MTKNDVINQIAREILHLETLQTRKMDSLDFKEQAVWSIAEALAAAYDAGRASVQPPQRKPRNSSPRPRP